MRTLLTIATLLTLTTSALADEQTWTLTPYNDEGDEQDPIIFVVDGDAPGTVTLRWYTQSAEPYCDSKGRCRGEVITETEHNLTLGPDHDLEVVYEAAEHMRMKAALFVSPAFLGNAEVRHWLTLYADHPELPEGFITLRMEKGDQRLIRRSLRRADVTVETEQ